MDVVVSGARGLIGSALCRSLEADGHRAIPLVRPGSSEREGINWDPGAGTIDRDALEGVDAVVHLAGEGVASHRWTGEHKRNVLRSRVDGTTLLATALAGLQRKPKALVSGSAVGYYGDRGSAELTEQSGPGGDFLADVCVQWESATHPAEDAGIRTAHIRTGIVLSTDGGALKAQLPLFRLGLGGQAGSGGQYLSWITLDDEIGAIRFLIDHDDVRGPVNLTGPTPCTNAEFTKALGRAVHRPTVVRIPHLVTRAPLGLGALAESLLFSSSRAVPAVLLDAGYRFRHSDLDEALAVELGKGRAAA